MDEHQFDDYLQDANETLSDVPEMDEANTKAKVVRPLLETLGWDINSDAVLEYGLQMGATTHNVDFALQIDGVPELFVEVKGAYKDISDRHLEQLFTYMKTQNVDWGLLTNGYIYFICRRRVKDNQDVVVDVLGESTLGELTDYFDLLSALSKQSIDEGRAEEIASNIYELREAYSKLQEERTGLVDELTDILVAELGEQVSGHVETAIRGALDDLSSSIESAAMGVPNIDPSGKFWSEVEAATGIVKQGSLVVFPESKTATECFTDFVDFLFEQGYLDPDDVPISSGPKRYLVNDSPTDKEGDEMFSPKEISGGFYLETNYSRNDIKQRILELSELSRE